MKKYTTFVLAALFAAAVISFGCSDSGDSTSGEVPDVSGSYSVKASNCPFALKSTSFSVQQSTSNRELLAISLGTESASVLESMKAEKMAAPDFYTVPATSGETAKKAATIVSANVSAGGGLTAQIKYGDATYDCSGTFKKDGETKKTDFNCNTGSTACSFSAEGTTTAAAGGSYEAPIEAPPAEGTDGGACINGVTCNEGLECVDNICKPVAAQDAPPAEGTEGNPCKDGTCIEGLVCKDGTCVAKTEGNASDVTIAPIQCANGMKLEGGKCVGAKKWAKFGTNDFLVRSMVTLNNKIFAATDKGVYRYDKVTDKYWDWKKLPPLVTNDGGNFDYGQVVNTLFVRGDTIYAGAESSGVFKSIDNGETWTPFSNGLTGSQIYVHSFESVGDKLYAGTCDGVFEYNPDAAKQQWNKYKSGLEGKCVLDLYYKATSAEDGFFYAGLKTGGVYRYFTKWLADVLWQKVLYGLKGDELVYGITSIGEKLHINTDKGIYVYKSGIGGWSWVPVGNNIKDKNVPSLIDHEGVLYAGTTNGVFKFAGTNWTQFNANNENLNSKSVNILIYSAPSFYAGTNKGVYNYVP